MRKLLGIVVLGMFLVSCSENQKNKVTTAIENCANDEFLKASVGPKFRSNEDLENTFVEDNKFLKLSSQTRKNSKIEKEAKLELYKFIEDNFKYSNKLKKEMYRMATSIAIQNKWTSIRHRLLKIRPLPLNSELSTSAEAELRKELSDYVYKFTQHMMTSHKSRIEEWDYNMSKFLMTDLNLKLFEKSFERKFIKCERLRKNSTISFDEKWK
jgi:hypothetical protein|tara:strand:+ start:50 stop:685 length:636 start_codon:yes stop_codon:yes gene_type:complete